MIPQKINPQKLAMLSSQQEDEKITASVSSLIQQEYRKIHALLDEKRQQSLEQKVKMRLGLTSEELQAHYIHSGIAGISNTRLDLTDAKTQLHPQFRSFAAQAVGEGVSKDSPGKNQIFDPMHLGNGLHMKGIDYFRAARKTPMSLIEFQAILKYLFLDTTKLMFAPLDRSHRIGTNGKAFDFKLFWLGSASVFFNCERLESGELNLDLITECWLDLSGSYFYNMELENQIRFVRGLKYGHGLNHCTRIDLACDDYQKYIDQEYGFKYLAQQVKKYNVTWIRTGEIINSFDSKGNEENTLYLGSRESSKFVRMYPTLSKHGWDAMRFEGEFKKNCAQQLYDQLCDIKRLGLDENNYRYSCRIAKVMGGVLLGILRFIVRDAVGSNGCTANAPSLPYWKIFTDRWNCGDFIVRLKHSNIQASIEKKKAWLCRSVMATLKIFKEGWGSQRFYEFLREEMNKKVIKDPYALQLIMLLKNDADGQINNGWTEESG